MKLRGHAVILFVSASVALAACSSKSSPSSGSSASTAPATTTPTTTTPTTTTTRTTTTPTTTTPTTTSPVSSSTPGATTSPPATSTPSPAPVDPNTTGPFAYAELDATTTVPASQDSVAIHVAYPTSGPTAGPYPLVVIGHGFLLDPSDYYGYAQRLASFGYVAFTAGFPTPVFGGSDTSYAQDLSGAIDWVVSQSTTPGNPLTGLADATHVGAMGHSLGGKIAIIAASQDTRIQAVLGLDPVDAASPIPGATTVPARTCLPLPIPTCFLGETIDGSGGFLGQSCAPAADNFDVLYQLAASPSLEVTLPGADHMSFLDDPSAAGLVGLVCQAATASHDDIIGLARAYTVAFFERTLRGNAGEDDFLTGATAQSRYVATGLATINAAKW